MRRVQMVPVCARCDNTFKYDPKLGDEDGGPVFITFPAYTVTLEDLCPDCMKSLIEWMGGRRRPASYVGSMRGIAKLSHLPHKGKK